MIKIFITFIATIILLMATTLLFEWQFIQNHWTRKTLVILLLLIQTGLAVLIIKQQIKDLK